MKTVVIAAAVLVLPGFLLIGCSNDGPVLSPLAEDGAPMAVEPAPGTGSFTLEAKYTFFRSYPSGRAIYLLRITPGQDFSGNASVSVSADRLIKTELTTTNLDAQTTMTELVLYPSKRLAIGFYNVTVTVSNQTHQESVELEIEMFNWGILSMNHAVTAREHFIDWLQIEHPELGNFSGERWDVYSHYPLKIVEHYTHLSDNWEFRVGCHVTWNPEDYFEVLWLRPRSQWDPILAAKRAWDDDSQAYVIFETPLEDWVYYYGY